MKMTDKQAYKLIGERAEELSKNIDIQNKMVGIAQKEGKQKAEQYLYMLVKQAEKAVYYAN